VSGVGERLCDRIAQSDAYSLDHTTLRWRRGWCSTGHEASATQLYDRHLDMHFNSLQGCLSIGQSVSQALWISHSLLLNIHRHMTRLTLLAASVATAQFARLWRNREGQRSLVKLVEAMEQGPNAPSLLVTAKPFGSRRASALIC